MFDEELPAKKSHNITRYLEPLSLDELAHYVTELEAEIVRVQTEMAKKKAHMDNAASLFKS
ncbi:MAG: DUF1192 domain-containing protein [Alphaproteobacteria bacterium]|nr:DUF1192 domain-containing protein [Alphaproteobacteria bacterium]NCQ87628.1 DUF1192 domain-containing protein [Alphaproteobacteria bacterium]NCT05863.1 DUF1192 domain-containing protein [Alphaproteobacteria bacterium]